MKCARMIAFCALFVVLTSGIDRQPKSANYKGLETPTNLVVDQGNEVTDFYPQYRQDPSREFITKCITTFIIVLYRYTFNAIFLNMRISDIIISYHFCNHSFHSGNDISDKIRRGNSRSRFENCREDKPKSNRIHDTKY